MNTEIDNACIECHNEIQEYLDGFDKKLPKIAKRII